MTKFIIEGKYYKMFYWVVQSRGDRSLFPVEKTEVHFQLGRQKCTSSWEDRSALPVEKAEMHFQLGKQKFTSS